MVDLIKLKYIVGHSPYSYHQVHTKAKLTRAGYRYWNGIRAMPLEVAMRIALVLEVDVREFLNADGLWLLRNSTKGKV